MKTTKRILAFFMMTVMLISTFTFISGAAKTNDIKVRDVVCTMYQSGATGRGFSWVTTDNAASDVQIVSKANYDSSFRKAKTFSGTSNAYRGQYMHHIVITNLKPGTTYYYRVGDKKQGVFSKYGKFRTDNQNSTFSFITIADVQASNEKNFALAYKTAAAAREVLPDAEFFINLGDYVNGNNNEEWDMYFSAFSKINRALTHVPVAGNHDGVMDGEVTGDLRALAFKNYFCLEEGNKSTLGGVYYSFDYGNAHFAVLNTNDMYPMSQAQRNWLKNDMSNSDAQWKIILAHRSLYSAGKNIDKPDTIIMRQVLIPLIDELGIDMVYAGHDHMYLRTAPVCNDEKTQTKYVTEVFNGQKTKFALNPKGTVYALPSTAGTKRYTVNENAIEPILSVADKAFSTRDKGGCFCTTQIKGNKLVYKAYTVSDKSGKVKLVDTFAIKKTEKKESVAPTKLDESFISSAVGEAVNLPTAIAGMLVSYFKLLFQVIKK